jgi:hypothetical protein
MAPVPLPARVKLFAPICSQLIADRLAASSINSAPLNIASI